MKYGLMGLLCLFSQTLLAGSNLCESTQSGDWSDSSIWTNCAGTFPNATSSEALIKDGHIIELDIDNIVLQNFTMETNTVLNVNTSINPVTITVSTNDFDADDGQLNINTPDFVITANNNNDIRLGLVDGATNLVLNSSGSTWLLDNMGSVTPLETITTDLAGIIRTTGAQDTFRVNSSTDTVINDNYLVGASSRAIWEQLGTGNIVFDNTVSQTSGSPQQITVNLTGGGDVVFNDTVLLGDLTVNGAGQALIGANVTTRDAGANQGLMTFNVPVIITDDVTFMAENGVSNIYFNNTLDDDGDNMTSSDVIIDSPNSIQLSAVGQSNGLTSLTLQNATSVLLTDDITTINNQTYLIDLMQFADVVFSSLSSEVVLSGINLNGNNFNTTINQASMLELNTLDIQNINTLTIGPLGQTALNGDFTLSGNLDLLNDMTLGADSVLTVNDLQTKAIDAGLSDLTIDVTSATSVINGTLTGVDATLTKTGAGTIITAFGSSLNNNITTDSIIVEAGRLNTGSPHNDRIVVNNDATLGGFGNIINTVTLNDQSTIDPGDEHLTSPMFMSGLIMGPNTTTHIDLIGNGLDEQDLVYVSGILTIDGQLSIGGSYSPQVGESFMLLENASVISFAGEFIGLPEGSSPSLGLTITYVGGDGNDVVINTICGAEVTVAVDTDSGAGSLRQAVTDVCDGGVINFDPNVQQINLNSLISIDKTITIDGGNTIVSGDFSSQVFNVETDGVLTMNSLRVMRSDSGFGAIRNFGQLTVNQSYFGENFSSGANGFGGGAIINYGQSNINQSVFYRNNAFRGGALFNTLDATMTVTNSTFYENGNTNVAEGGVIHNRGTATFINSTMVDSGDGDVAQGNTLSMFGDNAVMNVINSVITSPSTQQECRLFSGTINITNSFIDDGTCGATFSGDAMLGDWTDGTATRGFIGTASYVIPPLPGSPLVNTGSDVECPLTDQLGTSRPIGTGCDIGAVEITDDINPEVLALSLNGLPLNQCDQLSNGQTNSIEFTYSERMLLAEDLSNYVLEHAGEDFHFDDDQIKGGHLDNLYFIPTGILSDENLINPTITLTFDNDIPDGLIRLAINDSVTDEFNNQLNDGDNFYWQYRIDQGNLLNNGHFDDCGQTDNEIINNHWQYEVEFPPAPNSTQGTGSTFQRGFFDMNNSSHSASVDVRTDNQFNTYKMNQCTNLNGNLNLPLEMQATVLVYPSGGPRNLEQDHSKGSSSVNVELVCELWDQVDCMGSQLETFNHTFPPIEFSFDATYLDTNLGLPDSSTLSSLCEIKLTASDSNQSGIMLDGIRLIQQDLIFKDGFETVVDVPGN